MDSKGRIAFTSLGMLILDKVHLPSGKVFEDVLGGSGAYGMGCSLSRLHHILFLTLFKQVLGPDCSLHANYPSRSDTPSARATTFPLKSLSCWRIGESQYQ